MFYKTLGFAVWQGAKWYLGRKLPSSKLMAAGALGFGAATALALGTTRSSSS